MMVLHKINAGRVVIKEPVGQDRAEVRRVLEDHLGRSLEIANVTTLEDYDY